MPAGAYWTLRYEPTVDSRIQARVHAQSLRLDEFVQHVNLTNNRGTITLGVQFYEDREQPYNEQLAREVLGYRVIPREPEPERPIRSIRQILDEYISTPPGRVRIGHAFAAPIRNRLDYVSSARRTFLVPDLPSTPNVVHDPPYSDAMHRPLGNDQIGDALSHLTHFEQQTPFRHEDLLSVEQEVGHMSNLIARGLQVPEELLSPPPPPPVIPAIPNWLKPGAWARRDDQYVEVTRIYELLTPEPPEPTVHFKLWRANAPLQTLKLRDFLRFFTHCEKPKEPTSRYERIIKGI